MGAFGFEPSEPWREPLPHHTLTELAQASRVVMKGQDCAVLKDLARLGGSPHGAHPKVLVRFDPSDQSIHLEEKERSESWRGEPWLIKFQASGEHKEACAIEHLYARLAKECGLEMPETALFDLDRTHAAFGIRRFDCIQTPSGEQRAPLHTLAGVLHQDFRLPSDSYQDFLRVTRFLTRDQREVCPYNICVP